MEQKSFLAENENFITNQSQKTDPEKPEKEAFSD